MRFWLLAIFLAGCISEPLETNNTIRSSDGWWGASAEYDVVSDSGDGILEVRIEPGTMLGNLGTWVPALLLDVQGQGVWPMWDDTIPLPFQVAYNLCEPDMVSQTADGATRSFSKGGFANLVPQFWEFTDDATLQPGEYNLTEGATERTIEVFAGTSYIHINAGYLARMSGDYDGGVFLPEISTSSGNADWRRTAYTPGNGFPTVPSDCPESRFVEVAYDGPKDDPGFDYSFHETRDQILGSTDFASFEASNPDWVLIGWTYREVEPDIAQDNAGAWQLYFQQEDTLRVTCTWWTTLGVDQVRCLWQDIAASIDDTPSRADYPSQMPDPTTALELATWEEQNIYSVGLRGPEWRLDQSIGTMQFIQPTGGTSYMFGDDPNYLIWLYGNGQIGDQTTTPYPLVVADAS